MKRFTAIALVVLAGACTASTLQAQGHEVRADVPFSFAVGSKQLPAGHYTFITEPSYTIVMRDAENQLTILSRTEDAGSVKQYSSRLVFDKYGDQYFLREIRCASIAMNVEIPQSKQEKQIQTQHAWLGPDQVLLALN